MSEFWMGHQLLGDVIGMCAAAHLYAEKIGQPVSVWFDPTRRGVLKYFDGVEWVPREQMPNAVDCGLNPTLEEWPSMNGVKRFYRYMDPSLTPTKSFDIHFNRPRQRSTGLDGPMRIGLITHSNCQGDIDDETLSEMMDEVKRLYPGCRVMLFGNYDNTKIPFGVEDLRQRSGNIEWIVGFIETLDLLITPQSGPCFIAAGWNIPMWVYRSKERFWDYTLNYEKYQVERWWDRKVGT
jgi:hypothetical protein